MDRQREASPYARVDNMATKWSWKKTRDVGLRIDFWPLTWRFGADRETDPYCWIGRLNLGPFSIEIMFNVRWAE